MAIKGAPDRGQLHGSAPVPGIWPSREGGQLAFRHAPAGPRPSGGLGQLAAQLEAALGTTLPDWRSLEPHVRTMTYRPGDIVFPVGISHPYLYYVRRGLVRVSVFGPNGQPWIIAFGQEQEFVTSLPAIRPIWLLRRAQAAAAAQPEHWREVLAGRTTHLVTAVEHSELERIDYRPIERLALQHIEWAHIVLTATVGFSYTKERRQREFLTMTAEQRYRQMLLEAPELVRRVPQKDLALHLGITPEGLSRMAARVRREDAAARAASRP